MVFNSIGKTPEKLKIHAGQGAVTVSFRGVLKRPSQAWLLAVTRGVFQKFREDGLSPENTLTERKALNREFWRYAAVCPAI
jgi:hypothetical protein